MFLKQIIFLKIIIKIYLVWYDWYKVIQYEHFLETEERK